MSHYTFLFMNRLNLTESAISVSLEYSLLPKDLFIGKLFIFNAVGVVACGSRETSHRTSS